MSNKKHKPGSATSTVSDSGDADDISVEIPDDDSEERAKTAEKTTVCTSRYCHRSECHELSIIQSRSSNELLTKEARSIAIMRDLKQTNPSSFSAEPKKPSDIYNLGPRKSPFRFIVLGKRVCQDCYADFYCTTRHVLRHLQKRMKEGEEQFVDKRKQNGGNQFHTTQGIQQAREAMRDYMKQLERRYAVPLPPSVARSGKAIRVRAIVPLDFTNDALMTDYRKFCADRGVEGVSLKILKDYWNKNYPNLKKEERVRKHPYRDQRGRKYNKKKKGETMAVAHGAENAGDNTSKQQHQAATIETLPLPPQFSILI